MIHRIADQVQQRVGQLVQHAPIQFGVGTSRLPADVLALGPGQVADCPRSWSVIVETGTIRVRMARSCRSLSNRDSSLNSVDVAGSSRTGP